MDYTNGKIRQIACLSLVGTAALSLGACQEKKEETKSQNKLPAPPIIIPAETPKIFPTPSVPARARKKDRLVCLSFIDESISWNVRMGCKTKKKPRRMSKIKPKAATKKGSKSEIFIKKDPLRTILCKGEFLLFLNYLFKMNVSISRQITYPARAAIEIIIKML